MSDYDIWGPGSAGAIDFEARMRRRRFIHCVKRSEAAIRSGALDEARLALDEARELIPDAPEVVVLDAWLTDTVDGSAPSTTALAFQGDDDDLPASDERLHFAPELAETRPHGDGKGVLTRLPLAALPIVGLLGFGLGQISATRSHQAQPTAISADALFAGDEKLKDEGPQPAPPALVAVALVQDGLVQDGVVQDGLVQEKSAQEKPVQALDVQDAAVKGSLSIPDRAASPSRAASRISSAAAGDDEEIRAVLKRYEQAHNRLVAKIATAGWSGAKPGPLKSSSNASLPGRISLGVCDVTVSGEVGTARCAGTASWNEKNGRNSKLGSNPRTTQRQLAFDLRKSVYGWRIRPLTVE